MPTWKNLTDPDNPRYLFLCTPCHEKKREFLVREGWTLTRENEPAACTDCSSRCALTAGALWGAPDAERFAVCTACADYDGCAYQGRHYC